jgi:hypothetical protein
MKRIQFTSTGHSAVFGNFTAGDEARLPDDLANHFVHDAMAAKFVSEADVHPADETGVVEGEAGQDLGTGAKTEGLPATDAASEPDHVETSPPPAAKKATAKKK